MAHDTLNNPRLWQRFAREELDGLPPDERRRAAAEFEARFGKLTEGAAGDDSAAFADLVGLGGKGAPPFGDVAWPKLVADFDDAIVPSQLDAAAELDFMTERARRVFRVAEVLRRLYRDGRMRIHMAPARADSISWKNGTRYATARRIVSSPICGRSITAAPRGPRAPSSMSISLSARGPTSVLAQYFRDMTIGEVIRGGQILDQRPYGTIATVHRSATDLDVIRSTARATATSSR